MTTTDWTPEPKQPLRSEMGSSTADSVTVRGRDLVHDLMGVVNLGDMAFLELTGRLPGHGESIVFNAMLVALVEHGTTPSTLVTRLTQLGAPESLQGAVAAGLLGLGDVFVGTMEGSARMLQTAVPHPRPAADIPSVAREIVRVHRDAHQAIPGIGHPIHKPEDPRAGRLFELAAEHGLIGPYVALIQAIGEEARLQTGRPLPINVTGAIGALASELQIPWQICRGLGVMARAIGLVAHALEETRRPIAGEIWRRVAREADGPGSAEGEA